MEIQIREVDEASPEHYIQAILSLCFGGSNVDKCHALEKAIRCPTAHVYVAVVEDKVVGTGTYVLTPHPRLVSGMVYDIVVDSAYKGRGVIGQLGSVIKQAAYQDGCTCVMVGVFDSHEHRAYWDRGWRGNGVKVLYMEV